MQPSLLKRSFDEAVTERVGLSCKRLAENYVCQVCTFENPPLALSCSACGATRASDQTGDCWYCSQCTAENLREDTACVVCNYAPSSSTSHDLGGYVEDKSDGNWDCTACTCSNPRDLALCACCGQAKINASNTTSSSSSSSSPRMLETSAEASLCSQTTSDNVFHSSTRTDGIIELLHQRLQEANLSTSISICSPMPHISQRGYEGEQWSCGYRNIQMLCASLMTLPEYAATLFGGTGEVPDVFGIQAWIEKAWQDGFDPVGCIQLEGQLLGTRKWIGATECACLLRYMGVRACVVDFNYRDADIAATAHLKHLKNWTIDYDRTSTQTNKGKARTVNAKATKHPEIIDWCRHYFSTSWGESAARNMLEYLPPVYFQHMGHSRTIVGLECVKKTGQFNLLVFDPSQYGKSIHTSLTNGTGWQRYLKRGLHTLRKNQYQIVYIRPGVMSESERQTAKADMSFS